MTKPLRIWCNVPLDDAEWSRLAKQLGPHLLVDGRGADGSALLGGVDVAFGQPPADLVFDSRIRWLAVSSAGFTRYDTPGFREGFAQAGRWMSNASSVYAEPCAQHALAFMLAEARQLPACEALQAGGREWRQDEVRRQSRLLNGQSALFLGFGAIGRRLADLLAPFRMKIHAVRRRVYSEPGVHIIGEERVSSVLGQVDHVVNLLPENEATHHYVNARRLSWIRPGAVFYNIGRGSTVDQAALAEALRQRRLRAAYLDVTTPEPLPPHHELWTTPGCHITPHSAGGHADETRSLVDHFLQNFELVSRGSPPAVDRIV